MPSPPASAQYKGKKWKLLTVSDMRKWKPGMVVDMWQNNSGNAHKIEPEEGWNEWPGWVFHELKKEDGKLRAYGTEDESLYQHGKLMVCCSGGDPMYWSKGSKASRKRRESEHALPETPLPEPW